MSAVPAPPRGKPASSYQRDYILRLLDRRPELGPRQALHANFRRMLESACPCPLAPFRDGDSAESALYALDCAQASKIIGLLGGRNENVDF